MQRWCCIGVQCAVVGVSGSVAQWGENESSAARCSSSAVIRWGEDERIKEPDEAGRMTQTILAMCKSQIQCMKRC